MYAIRSYYASVPARAEPELGPDARLDYARVLPAIVAAGYTGAFGCEYRPAGTVEAGSYNFV